MLPLGDVVASIAHVGNRPASLSDPAARVIERDYHWGPARELPRHAWRFTPDGDGVEAPEGFQPGKLYEIVYTALGAPVTGAGLAAHRDLVSFFATPGPTRAIHWQARFRP